MGFCVNYLTQFVEIATIGSSLITL